MIITDKELIENMRKGKVEISPGYSVVYKKEKGNFQGQDYDYIQTDIFINHIAIVDKGRCDGSCKITDAKKDIINPKQKQRKGVNMAKLRIGDAEVEVCDTVLNAYTSLQGQVKSLDEENENLKKEIEEKDEEAGKKDGEIENLKKENEDMEEEVKKAGDVNIHALAAGRAILLAKVSAHIGDTDVSKMNDAEIMTLAISKVSDVDLTSKSEDYIKGMFESMVIKSDGANDSLNAFGKTIVQGGDVKVSARDTYIKKMIGEK